MTDKNNILVIMVDQMRYPRFEYGGDYGFIDPIKRILGFKDGANDSNEFKTFFPGFSALADNAVVLTKHRAATAACVPSRTALFTGQYGTKTGATQTDGVFKDGASQDFPWLNYEDFPTLGHWMRKNGYSTHYFGKWHISGEDTDNLENYGFADWDLSYPDPHGTLTNNLGFYRDYQFRDLATAFLRRQGLGVPYDMAHAEANVANANKGPNDPTVEPEEIKPWFAVASFTNPHDIGSYPVLPRSVTQASLPDAPYTAAVPPERSLSTLPEHGTMSLRLNRRGFPQHNANLNPTWNEDLLDGTKPDCQFDYVYKMGLALASKNGRAIAAQEAAAGLIASDNQAQMDRAVEITLDAETNGLPLPKTSNPEAANRAFMQYYGYLIHEVDQHIHAVLEALEESGQADNTIVIFCSDHGEYGGAHGQMTEKWHSAYEEAVHVPMIVRFPSSVYHVPSGLKQIEDVATSHIDILPTILGLSNADTNAIKGELTQTYVLDPVGNDLSALLLGESETPPETSDGAVLFINHDSITEPLVDEGDFDGSAPPTSYQVFEAAVEQLKTSVTDLASGSVRRPSLLNCVISDDNWKLVRYFEPVADEPNNFENNNQFELYDLTEDPLETNNLVNVNTPFMAKDSANQQKADDLLALLEQLEADKLYWDESVRNARSSKRKK